MADKASDTALSIENAAVFKLGHCTAHGDSAKAVLLEGFSFDATDVKTEVAQRNQIFGDAQKLLEVGLAGDTDTALEKIKTDSEGAGFQSVLDEYQRQIDEFLAAKDK